jgi:hypothetical protein
MLVQPQAAGSQTLVIIRGVNLEMLFTPNASGKLPKEMVRTRVLSSTLEEDSISSIVTWRALLD